jgi:hypothetical protein
MNNYNDFSRLATMDEINNFNMVETALISDELFSKAIDLAGDCLCSYGKEHKKAYDRAYKFCKAHGFTVNALTDWYCIDAY